jgi:hypothetical protein
MTKGLRDAVGHEVMKVEGECQIEIMLFKDGTTSQYLHEARDATRQKRFQFNGRRNNLSDKRSMIGQNKMKHR